MWIKKYIVLLVIICSASLLEKEREKNQLKLQLH